MNLKYPFLDLGRVNEPYADELVAAAERVIRSGRYIGGPKSKLLKEICRHIPARLSLSV